MNYKVLGGRKGPEYSRSVKTARAVALLGLIASQYSCSLTAQPTDSLDPTSTRTRATETFTPTPNPTTLPGDSYREEQLVAFGRAIGAGGEGRIEPLFSNRSLQGSLLESGLIPLLDSSRSDSRGEDLLTQTLILPNGTRVCFPNSPVELFNPNVSSGRDEWIYDSNFIRYYGESDPTEVRFQTVPAVSLDNLSSNIVCVNTVARADRQNIFDVRPGTVMTILLDNESGVIYGGFRSVFAASDQLGFDPATGRLTVNGQTVWFEGPGMEELLSQTEREFVATREGVSDAGILGLEVNEQEGQRYYRAILESLLRSDVNDEYFRTNFGVTDPDASGAVDQLLSQLRSRNFRMPAGLVVPGINRPAGSLSDAELGELGEFTFDTVALTVITAEEFIQNHLGPPDDRIPPDVNKLRLDSHDIFINAIYLRDFGDGIMRLSFVFATANETYRGDLVGISGMDLNSQASVDRVMNRWIDFIPHIILNMQNAIEIRGGIRYIPIYFLFGNGAGFDVDITGYYDFRDPTVTYPVLRVPR